MRKLASVGRTVGIALGWELLGVWVGFNVGIDDVGKDVGGKDTVGPEVGTATGEVVGCSVGVADGIPLGKLVGECVGASDVGLPDGRRLGTCVGVKVETGIFSIRVLTNLSAQVSRPCSTMYTNRKNDSEASRGRS